MKKANAGHAYAYIRRRILNGAYPPGLSLAENALAAEIGGSRTPVREALRQLATAREEMENHVKYNLQMIALYERRTPARALTEEELGFNVI